MNKISKFIDNILAVLRWARTKIFYFRSIHSEGLFYIGSNSSLKTQKGIISFKKKPRIDKNVTIKAFGKISIGSRFSINPYSRIVGFDNIEIGNNVLIAQFVSILDHDHSIDLDDGSLNFRGDYTTAPIIIGDNVWIGDKVTILKGVTIGSNVVIGANSLVNKSIPSNSIAGGVPCKVIKELS